MNICLSPVVTRLNNVQRPTRPERLPLFAVVEEIQTDRRLKTATRTLCWLHHMQHIAGCETAKGQLPAVLFAGEFDHTSDGGLRKHSGLIVLDFNALDKQE